jgi:hypothetical protein
LHVGYRAPGVACIAERSLTGGASVKLFATASAISALPVGASR